MVDSSELSIFGFETFEPNKPGSEEDNSYTARLYRDVTGLMKSEMGSIYVDPKNLRAVTLLPLELVYIGKIT